MVRIGQIDQEIWSNIVCTPLATSHSSRDKSNRRTRDSEGMQVSTVLATQQATSLFMSRSLSPVFYHHVKWEREGGFDVPTLNIAPRRACAFLEVEMPG